jgi:thermostable hemolysin
MDVRLAERGSSEWQAAADLMHRRYAEEYGADRNADPDSYLSIRAGADDGHMPVVGCAGLTYHSGRPFVSELCAGGSVEELCLKHLDLTIDPVEVVEIGPAAGTGLGTGAEVGRLVPIVAWTQGMRYVLGMVTRTLRRSFAHLDVPFTMLAEASDQWMTEAERASWGTYFTTQEPMVVIIPLDSLGDLMRSSTGRYRFADVRLSLVDKHPADTAELR